MSLRHLEIGLVIVATILTVALFVLLIGILKTEPYHCPDLPRQEIPL